MKEITLYHGSYTEVKKPDLNHSRLDIDFGPGIYLTEDRDMAEKWAANKRGSVVSVFRADLSELNVYKFESSKEWLDFIVDNRNLINKKIEYNDYDVIVGPVSDDRMMRTIRDYEEDRLSDEESVELMTTANYSFQYCFKTEKTLEKLIFQESYQLDSHQKKSIRKTALQEREKFAEEANAMFKRMLSSRKKGGRKL